MNEQILLFLVVVGGAAGLAIVGVAFWMMRKENLPDSMPAPATEPAYPVADAPSGDELPPAVEAASAEAPGVTPTALAPEDTFAHPPPLTHSGPRPEVEPVPPAPTAEPAPTAAPGESRSAAASESDATPVAPAAEEEVLRLWRSPTGQLSVEVNGKRFLTREEITDFATAQHLINMARGLNQFLHLTPGAMPKKEEPSRPVVKVSLEEAATQPVTVPTMDIRKQMRYLREQSKKPEIQIKSIMDEINDILQKKIAGTPLAGRGLKVADGLHSGIFSLDGFDYESLDELPDPEARESVRAAIQEWDTK